MKTKKNKGLISPESYEIYQGGHSDSVKMLRIFRKMLSINEVAFRMKLEGFWAPHVHSGGDKIDEW